MFLRNLLRIKDNLSYKKYKLPLNSIQFVRKLEIDQAECPSFKTNVILAKITWIIKENVSNILKKSF